MEFCCLPAASKCAPCSIRFNFSARIFIDGIMLPVRAAKEADFSRVALANLRSIVQQSAA